MTDPLDPTRRALLAGAMAAASATTGAAAQPQAAPLITILGDSITSGYGLTAAQALPAQLQAALGRLGVRVQVRGAARAGDTTADGLRRVDSVPRASRLVVVALGGNDLLRGLPFAQVRSNLDAIVRRLQARGLSVMLAGMRAPPELGAFARTFDAVFSGVARERNVAFYPFLLEGVALDPRYNQPDRVHPNAAGARVIAERLAPSVARALRGAQPGA